MSSLLMRVPRYFPYGQPNKRAFNNAVSSVRNNSAGRIDLNSECDPIDSGVIQRSSRTRQWLRSAEKVALQLS